MFKEFKEFISKGSVMDMAIGIVIGGAFAAIVNSVVNDILMPIIGFITAGVDFTDLKVVLQKAVLEGGEVVKPEVSLNYGSLIQTIINFLIISLFIFLMVKGMNQMRRQEEEPEEVAPKSAEVLLLEEIRDSLKK
ncbi:MAG: large-conductance mechanosensitive channel protein MscL [Eubacteriales bacterium]|nr:large-conductance mechanosensitive channel protein MscL [Clostridiales bacterium]MDY5835586.1 large-conductance mechanosensitive channel protein MscL [Eubacteriales bacterium]